MSMMAASTQQKRKTVRREKQREEEMLTSRQPGSGTPSAGVGVWLGSRFILACQSLERSQGVYRSARQPTPIPLAQPRLGSWPAAAEQAVEWLLMRMVEDGNGRARAGRGRRAREWRGAGAFRLWRRFYKVVTACAWEARHSIEQVGCMCAGCCDAGGGKVDFWLRRRDGVAGSEREAQV
uniref:Uncharacterized protein n=1 Tax=Oryza punctata TaxID=4537 RepID=A0A0E0JV64_ORYPU